MLILIHAGLWVLELKRHCSPCGQIRTPLRIGYRPTPSLHAAPTGHRQPSEFTAKARFTISLHHPEGSVYSSCSIQDKRRAWVLAWSDDSLAGPAVAAQWCLIAVYWVVVQSIHHHSWAMGNGVGGGCRHGHVHGPRAILLFLLSSKIYALFVVFKKIYVTLVVSN